MRTSIAIAICLTIIVISFEVFFLFKKFPVFTPSVWRREAVELSQVGSIRIGIVRGRHGAEFVRLRFNQSALRHLKDADAAEIEAAMREQLRLVPQKFAFECVWYFAILFGVLYLPIKWSVRRHRQLLKVALVSGAAVFAAVFLFHVPLLVGYDGSIFSTWAGPGAYSWSRPAPAITGILGTGISYRFFMEALITPAMEVVLPVFDFLSAELDVRPWVWAAYVAAVYAGAGALVGFVVASARIFLRRSATVIG